MDAAVALGIALQLCDWANCVGHHRTTLGARGALLPDSAAENLATSGKIIICKLQRVELVFVQDAGEMLAFPQDGWRKGQQI